MVDSRLPAGADIGVEGIGFVPLGLGRGAAAYFADLGAPGAPTRVNDDLLVLRGRGSSLARGSSPVTSSWRPRQERERAVRCAVRCTIRQVAAGPTTTHGEGHITSCQSQLGPRPDTGQVGGLAPSG